MLDDGRVNREGEWATEDLSNRVDADGYEEAEAYNESCWRSSDFFFPIEKNEGMPLGKSFWSLLCFWQPLHFKCPRLTNRRRPYLPEAKNRLMSSRSKMRGMILIWESLAWAKRQRIHRNL